MAKGYIAGETCSFKVNVFHNRDGNVLQPGETIAGQKTVTFGGFKSDIPASEAVNDGENSSALHNGVAGLMWLLSGSDENFDTLVKRTLIEEVDDV